MTSQQTSKPPGSGDPGIEPVEGRGVVAAAVSLAGTPCSFCGEPAVFPSPTGHSLCAACVEDGKNYSPLAPGGTLADLLDKTIEPIRWVVEGLIPEGLTLLAGKPKLGKSWLALSVSLAVCSGTDALEHKTRIAEVLYVSLEDGERRLQDRVRILGGGHYTREALARFHYRTDWPTIDHGGLDQLEEWMVGHSDTRLIVIDTYGKVRGDLPGKDRYAEEYGLLGRLQTFATRHRIAVLLVHHLRKQGADDWLEQLSGSQAITGTADTLLGLFRERGLMDATLRMVSREADEKDLALQFHDGRWTSMGDAAAYRTTVERSEVLDALGELPGGEGKVSQIAAMVEKTTANTSKLLVKMHKEGMIRMVRYGTYALNDPVEVVEVGEPTPPTSTTSTTSTTSDDQGSVARPDPVAALDNLRAAGIDFEEVEP